MDCSVELCIDLSVKGLCSVRSALGMGEIVLPSKVVCFHEGGLSSMDVFSSRSKREVGLGLEETWKKAHHHCYYHEELKQAESGPTLGASSLLLLVLGSSTVLVAR